jgi:hypothetical protein
MITLEEQQLREHLSVDEITFAIPAQSFAISCAISAEEALPVVTEFALRIAYVCGTVSPAQLQDFFGFSKKETDAVLHSLLDERLLQWHDEHLELTSYALARFQDSSDNLPRFFKIQDWSAEVVFDLISFSPAGRTNRLKRVRSQVELATRSLDKQSRTLQYAEQSFQQNFRQICNKEKAEIYKISAIDAGERFSIPLPCTFHLEFDGQTSIRRDIDDASFGSRLEIAEAITDALVNQQRGNNQRLREFASTFDDSLLQRYLADDTFDLRQYVQDVHLTKLAGPADESVTPILGAFYLPRNTALVVERIRSAVAVGDTVISETPADQGEIGVELQVPNLPKTPRTALWWAPQSSLWARSRGARELGQKIDRLLLAKDEQDKLGGLHVIVPAPRQSPRERLSVYQDQFARLLAADMTLMDGNLEILLVPDVLVCATFHFHLAHQAVAIPIGFMSSSPDHIAAASTLLTTRIGSRFDLFKAARENEGDALKQSLAGILGQLSAQLDGPV